MAVKAGTAYVDIEGDFSGLNKQVASHFRRISKNAGKTGRGIGKTFGVGMAAGIGAAVVAGKQLFDFGKATVDTASDINESLSKNQVLFGKYAKGIEDFSKRSANSFGISRKAALEYTGTFGNLFSALGISNKESAKFSTNLVKLAADMASFNNSTPEEALDAIRSGLVGETEPLRRFGVNMNDATLKAEAMRKGLIKNTKEALTPQQRALAAQSLIFKQTNRAQGDFSRTSDQLANAQRRLQARWEDMKGTLGTALLPAVKNVSGALLDIADDVQPKVERAIKDITRIFGRDDLDFGEKIQRSWDAIKLEFGPLARQLRQGIDDAHVGDKFKEVIREAAPLIASGVKTVGLRSAEYWWEGFKAAPLWAKVVSGGWLAAKLGLAGPAFKWLTGRGGVGGGLGGRLTMPGGTPATPMYVIVENWQKLAAASAGGGAALGAGKRIPFDPKVGTGAGVGLGTAVGASAATATTTTLASRLKGKLGSALSRAGRTAGPAAGIAIAGTMGSAILGDVVGGSAGKKIASIGGRAALWGGIGATAGSFIAPGIGTAIGGAGGAIVGGLTAALQKEKPDLVKAGAQLMKDMLPPDIFERTVSQDLAARAGKLQEDIRKRTEAIRGRGRPDAVIVGRGVIVPDKQSKEEALKQLALTDADKAQIAQDYRELGKLTGDAYVAGVETHHEFFGAQELTRGFTEELKKMKPQARQAALDTMANFARTMEQQGRLPKGATARIVTNIKRTLGILPSEIKSVGKRGMDALTHQLKRRDAVNAAEEQRKQLAHTWGDFPRIAKFSGKNAAENFTREIDFLKNKVKNSNGRMKQQAIADLKAVQGEYRKWGRLSVAGFDAQLKDLNFKGSKRMRTLRENIVTDAARMARGVKGSGADMNRHLDAALKDMGIKGDKRSRHVRDVVKRAIRQMATGVGGSSENAASSLFSALNNMGANGTRILKALGLKPPAFVLRRPPNAPGANGELRPTQRGGYFPGQRLGDRIPALLEEGEYVLNRKAVKKVGKSTLDKLNYSEAPRFQRGGSVSGDTDVLPALLQRLRMLSRAANTPIFITSGRRTLAEQAALFASKGAWSPGHAGAAPPSANAPHVRGIAADISPGVGALGRLAGRFGLSFPMGNEPWHIQLLDAAATAVVQKIGRYRIQGPGGILKSAAQGIADRTRNALNKYIANQAESISFGETGPTSGATARGNGANLMRQISQQRGWNFADWWKLDARESSHGTNLANPTSTARLRGQFLDSNWGRYGPGSDPRQNPSMTQQIYAMAQYISERYGNPTRAWSAWMSHYPPGWYQRGGLATLMNAGGDPKKGRGKKKLSRADLIRKAAKVKYPGIGKLKHAKQHKPSKHISRKMVRSLGKAGASGLQKVMDTLHSEADKYADWAQRANDITDTEALQAALNAEMTRRGGRSNMTDQQLLGLFPAKDQDAFVQQWLRGNASFNGGIQTDWLTKELNQLLAWRNALIDNPPIFKKLLKAAVAAYRKLKREIRRIQADINKYTRLRERARTDRDAQEEALKESRQELAKDQKALKKERDKKKPSQKRIKQLQKEIDKDHDNIDKHRKRRDVAQFAIDSYNDRLDKLRNRRKVARAQTQTLGGDDAEPGDRGEGGRIGTLSESIADMATSLTDVHGLGTTMQKFISPSQFQLGTLGGTILGVQNEILGITRNPPRASAEQAGADPSEVPGEDETKEILRQLLQEANLRTAVSEAQFEVFRGLPIPFGGSFAEGGTVPGPIGAPRMIMAHGGERVISNDSNNTPTVSVNFASGMEWLKQFVDIRVEQQTRRAGRFSERKLAGGRAGMLR